MSVTHFLKSSGWAALAAALVVTALPTAAAAQDRGGEREETSQPRNAMQARAEAVARAQEQRAQRQAEQRAAPARQRTEQAARPAQPRNDQAARQAPQPSARAGDWQRYGQDARANDQAARQAPQDRRAVGRPTQPDRPVEQARSQDRNRSYADQDRNRTYTNNDQDRQWRDNDRPRGTYTANNDRRDSQQWDRRWRDNNRYDWQRYRNQNRLTFRIGVYNSPYRGYSYRRFGTGSFLQSLFFSNRYWINDPWRYRLPDVYGPYRWVRYYDDVLLVDIYSGEVVDVLYDFFW